MTKEITEYQTPTTDIIERATSLSIKTPEDMVEATDVLSQLNMYLKSVVAYKEKKTKPLNEALKVIRAETKPIEDELKRLIEGVRSGVSAYQTQAKLEAAKQAEKITEKVVAGKLKAETGIKKLEAITGPDSSIQTASGALSFRTDRKFEVVDVSKLPVEYVLANEVAIRAAMKKGVELPGVRYFDVEVPINSR